MDSFWENRKKSKNGCFLAIFGLILAMFLTSQPYDFDAFAHAGAPLGVEWLCKISWKSYGQFLRNSKFSWKGREKKKQHDCISSRKFFPTPKNPKGSPRRANSVQLFGFFRYCRRDYLTLWSPFAILSLGHGADLGRSRLVSLYFSEMVVIVNRSYLNNCFHHIFLRKRDWETVFDAECIFGK